jgi:hypothetical protein
MGKLARNVVLLAKIQPSAGIDPVPTAGLNAILARNLTVNPIVAEFAQRDNIQPYLGNQGSVNVSCYATIGFEVELQGSGAAGTAPKFGPLLRACAFAETITASVSAVYNPITTGHEKVTFYYYLDGILYKMTDAKGTVALVLDARGIPVMRYSFTGYYSTALSHHWQSIKRTHQPLHCMVTRQKHNH